MIFFFKFQTLFRAIIKIHNSTESFIMLFFKFDSHAFRLSCPKTGGVDTHF